MVAARTQEERVEATLAKQFEAMNRHDADAAASIYSPEAVVSDPMYPEPLEGREAIAKDLEEFFTAFPDLKVTLKQVLVSGDRYAAEFSMSGTHTGPLVGPAGHIPASNKRIDVRGGAFARLDGEGRIAEEQRYYDLAGLLGQLGLMR